MPRAARGRYYVETVGELSWTGILAGAAVGLAVGGALMLAGAGFGLVMADQSAGARPSAATFGWTTLIWLMVVQIVSMAAGGYVAGRALAPDGGGATVGDELRSDAGSILQRAWSRGEFAPSDKAYLATLLSQHYGLSQQEAEQRVSETETRIRDAANTAQTRAREAAEAAAKAAKVLAFVGFAIAVLGAIAAIGGGLTAESHRRLA